MKKSRTHKHTNFTAGRKWARNKEADQKAGIEKNVGREGHVYAVYLGMGSMVKIGRAKDVARRVHELRASNPSLKFLWSAWVKDSYEVEKKLHNMFKSKKVEREVFNLHPNDIKMIDMVVSKIKESY